MLINSLNNKNKTLIYIKITEFILEYFKETKIKIGQYSLYKNYITLGFKCGINSLSNHHKRLIYYIIDKLELVFGFNQMNSLELIELYFNSDFFEKNNVVCLEVIEYLETIKF